ncbi:hypothetical protein O0L34_g19166 [Tuta absoluta]|nr:hypothetical protein O0L34_g19166 [Tuta absoluta]
MLKTSDTGSRMQAVITFDEPKSYYYSGQVLKGNVEFKLTTPLSYSVINVNFLGEARVSWSKSEIMESDGEQKRSNVEYKGIETYFNTTICAAGGKGPITLPPGEHKVPFQFQIPHNAPSYFHGEHGWVGYKVTAYIEYPDPLKRGDTLEEYFYVVAPLDLNMFEDDVKLPLCQSFEKVYGGCCWSVSYMRVKMLIPASGFCPGQAIPINISADNESSVKIKKITIQLLERVHYKSTHPKDSSSLEPTKVLETVETGPILANTKRHITHELIVPSFIVPNLKNCELIFVRYFLKVTIQLSGDSEKLEDENEIRLGLVPLAALVDNYEHPMQIDLPQAPIPDPKFILPPPVQNMPNPSNTMQNSAAYKTASPPFPSSVGSFPNVTSYPPNATSHQPYENSYAPNAAPYPSNPSPFPAHATAYPPGNANYPHPQPGIPMSSFRTSEVGFGSPPRADHGQIPPYPGANLPYPGPNSPINMQ